jgi:hypothetical protein
MIQSNLRYETDREKLRRLLIVFEANWSCPECHDMSAYWLETCVNPLHELHQALWELDQEEAKT